MEKLSAFGGDEKFRARFLDALQWHQDQDMIAQGTYGEGLGKNWRGCAVGCSWRSLNKARRAAMGYGASEHDALAMELGIPAELTRLEDGIFEGLPVAEARKWPVRFGKAIRAGADLSSVWPKFAIWLLTVECPSDSGKRIAALYERRLAGDEPTREQWAEARTAYAASAAAANAAADAADGAAAYAYAYADADAADAAAAAARQAARKRQATNLLQLMRACR